MTSNLERILERGERLTSADCRNETLAESVSLSIVSTSFINTSPSANAVLVPALQDANGPREAEDPPAEPQVHPHVSRTRNDHNHHRLQGLQREAPQMTRYSHRISFYTQIFILVQTCGHSG